MADINAQSSSAAVRADRDRTTAGGPLSAEIGPDAREALMAYVELLFFAYRDFTGDPDSILAELDFGRAHHRVLHFVSRYPGLRVADLLDILKITKQSLARVLRELVEHGYVEQRPGAEDRRERRLYVTDTGRELAARLAAPQITRIAEALRLTGGRAPALTRDFLFNMINAEDRGAVERLLALPCTAEDAP